MAISSPEYKLSPCSHDYTLHEKFLEDLNNILCTPESWLNEHEIKIARDFLNRLKHAFWHPACLVLSDPKNLDVDFYIRKAMKIGTPCYLNYEVNAYLNGLAARFGCGRLIRVTNIVEPVSDDCGWHVNGNCFTFKWNDDMGSFIVLKDK